MKSGINRRDVLLGGALLTGAGGAAALVPRGRLVLMPKGHELEAIVPKKLGGWTYVPTPGIVMPRTEGTLSAKLYGDVLSRVYVSESRLPVILVMAYGPVQNDLLQLHRPEVCYSAVGFQVSGTTPAKLPLAAGVELPIRELVAESDRRVETITYWTRVGDDLPTNGTEQRIAKLKQQWAGYVADGILVRMSCAVPPEPGVRDQLAEFARELVKAVPAVDLPALIGRPLAARLA
ncbi:MAG: EpsI family protein [Sphingomonadales bacterium 32-65-25]|nr:MAG: EpsI family protein [Sphingomonadales bacterium 12-62-5]OYX76985.1 MAG: EpsI family protein [Sphingomonadales bacterium 32-65-25]